MYQLTKTTSIIRISDGAIIPNDVSNTDYKEYLAWTLLGNTAAQATKKTTSEIYSKIKEERDRRKSLGVKVSGKWFHTDTDSRIQQLGLVILGANIPAGLQWKTMDGSFITMTPALVMQIFSAIATLDITLFTMAETHKAAMESATDPELYDYIKGWPQNYENS